MLFPLPTYDIREYGSALEGGYLCPCCKRARLKAPPQKAQKRKDSPEFPDALICPSCGGRFTRGWRRFHFASSSNPPKVLGGTPVENLGGFYQTIQGYAAPPALGLPTEDTNSVPHLGDFVVDLDREDLGLAKADALTVWEYLDDLAPNQVRLYFSGSKGFHLIVPWQALGAVPNKYLTTRIYRRVASIIHQETTVFPDYKIYSMGRMLRMPDSWHPKTGRYKVEILPEEMPECESLATAPRGPLNTQPPVLAPRMQELYLEARELAERDMEAFSDSNEEGVVKFTPETTGTPPCMEWVFQNGLPGHSSRHAIYLMMARYWLSAGIPLQAHNSFGHLDKNCALSLGREFARQPSAYSDTPLNERIRDIEACLRYVYNQNSGFKCRDAQALGLCSDTCPLKQVSAHPMAALFGISV